MVQLIYNEISENSIWEVQHVWLWCIRLDKKTNLFVEGGISYGICRKKLYVTEFCLIN